MSRNEISLGEFLRRISDLSNKSVPVACVFDFNGCFGKLYGMFVASVTAEELVISTSDTLDLPEAASTLTVPLRGCRFASGDTNDLAGLPPSRVEGLVLKFGNSALRAFLPDSTFSVNLFFTE